MADTAVGIVMVTVVVMEEGTVEVMAAVEDIKLK
jgi:hypothetical protein